MSIGSASSFLVQRISLTMRQQLASFLGLLLLWRGRSFLVRRAVKRSPHLHQPAVVLFVLCNVILGWSLLASLGVDWARFLKLFAAGGSCAVLMHVLTTPVDVVRTKMQLEPERYPSVLACVSRIINEDGPFMFLQGFGATALGYLIHGGLKYAVYEQLRTLTMVLTRTPAGQPLSSLHFVTSATVAELVASTALCPLESVRIRMVQDRTFARDVWQGLAQVWAEGSRSMYKGLMPLIAKQCPYTLAQFWTYEWLLAGLRATWIGPNAPLDAQLPVSLERRLSLLAGLLSGIAAAFASQPGDTILSRINKHHAGLAGLMLTEIGQALSTPPGAETDANIRSPSASLSPTVADKNRKQMQPNEIPMRADQGSASNMKRFLFERFRLRSATCMWLDSIRQSWMDMWTIARELGPRGMFLGFVPRCAQVMILVSGQFLFYAEIKAFFGIPETLGRGSTHRP
jgi:solute carrier family 25 phosphate transporter 3